MISSIIIRSVLSVFNKIVDGMVGLSIVNASLCKYKVICQQVTWPSF